MTRAVLLTLVAACLACGQGGSLPVEVPVVGEAELAARARADYVRDCAGCHGSDGTGRDALPRTSERPPDLTRLAERLGSEFSERWVADVIAGERTVPAHGPREMPVWKHRFGSSGVEAAGVLWAQRRLNALASYVVSLQASPAPRDAR
jgi:hypothetical protein